MRGLFGKAVFITVFVFMLSPCAHCGEINSKPFPSIKGSDSILIFAPHPDDESLGTGGLIRTAVESKAQVTVVVFTNGSRSHDSIAFDAFLKSAKSTSVQEPLGHIRRDETLNALRELGLGEDKLIFLGYPDGGLRTLFNDYWDCDRLYRAGNDFNMSDHSPYGFSYQKDAPYCGANVVANLVEIFLTYKPNIIFYPDDGDFHNDHWATSAFVRYSGSVAGYDGEWYTYLVHKGDDWPAPPEHLPKTGLSLPPELSVLDASWLMLPLNPDQVAHKEKAITSHQSQLFLWKDYLMSFIRVNEIFGAYPYVKISRVGEPPNFFRDGPPPSSFSDVRGDYLTGSLQTSADLTSMAMAYNDKDVFLVLQSAKDIETRMVHRFHLRMWDKKQYTRLDVKIKGKEAAYEWKAHDSIMPDQKPGLQVQGNMMVVTIPYYCIQSADEIMLSADVNDPEDKTTLDFISFRDLAFTK